VALIAENDARDFRFVIAVCLSKLFLQMFARKLQGRELVMIVRATQRRQSVVADRIVARISRRIFSFGRSADLTVALEIQTKLETAWMKGAAPVKIARRLKIVPLDRDPHGI